MLQAPIMLSSKIQQEKKNIRDTRCPSGSFVSDELPASKNNETNHVNADSQPVKVYMKKKRIIFLILTIY